MAFVHERTTFPLLRSGAFQKDLRSRFGIDTSDATFYNAELILSRGQTDRFVLARKLVDISLIDSCVFCKTDASVWHSGEDRNLINKLLVSLDLNYDKFVLYPIEYIPDDREDAASLVFLALIFGWDCLLCGHGYLFKFHHDDFVLVEGNGDFRVLFELGFEKNP
jgi:hypothetical protein